MHGQKKVQRTEEEKQSTKKRFQKYQAAMTKILKKRNALMQPDKTQSASGAATEDSEGQKQRVMQRPSNKQYIRQELAEACRQSKCVEMKEAHLESLQPQIDDLWKKVDTLIRVNPDAYPLWNIRRELLFHKMTHLQVLETSPKGEQKEEEIPQSHTTKNTELRTLINTELSITAYAIEKLNVKSYGAWYHRKWIVDNFPEFINCKQELELCNQLLVSDMRNFHCWNYRRHIVKRGNISLETELDYTENKINANFSNYSAWHYRTILLGKLGKITIDRMAKEISFLRNATYTQPEDQSIWFYQRWILRQLVSLYGCADAEGRARILEIISSEKSALAELHEYESKSKYAGPLFQLASVNRLLTTLKRLDEAGIFNGVSQIERGFSHVFDMAAQINEDPQVAECHQEVNGMLDQMKSQHQEHAKFYEWMKAKESSHRHSQTFAVLPFSQNEEL